MITGNPICTCCYVEEEIDGALGDKAALFKQHYHVKV